MSKVWFITGTTSGFGREFAIAALDRGDRVAASARHPERLADLQQRYGELILPLQLDVTDRDHVFSAMGRAAEHFGTLDVIVNNAGFGHLGMVEELSEADIRSILETNLLGALWVTQAALPVLRQGGGGRILQVTSEGGVRAFPEFGAYHASKWALEGLSQSLAQEVAEFGVKVTMVEPGPYATSFGTTGLARSEEEPVYADLRAGLDRSGWRRGTPSAVRGPILEIVDSEQPPLRVFFGHSFPAVERQYLHQIDEWRTWQPLAERAFGDEVRVSNSISN